MVRVSWPSRGGEPGSTPSAFIRCSSLWVPQVPAAKTTCSAVNVRTARSAGPVRRPTACALRASRDASTGVTPTARRGSGRTPVTVVSGWTSAPALLGQVQVVLDQGVLGVVPAAGHALAALDAPGALGSGAAEERVGVVDARRPLAEEHADRGRRERVRRRPSRRRPPCMTSSAGGHASGCVDDAEHPRGLVVVRRAARSAQSVMSRPLRVVEERLAAARRACWRRPASRRRRPAPASTIDVLAARGCAGCRSSPSSGAHRKSLAVARRSWRSPRRRTAGRPRARRPGSPSRSAAAR